MNVVHLITSDIGGAAKAAFRLNEALNANGIISKVITMSDALKNKKYSERVIQRIKMGVFARVPVSKKRRYYYFNDDLNGVFLDTITDIKDADIIHLHWVTDGMLSLTSMKRLFALKKPIVWTLHDMHPFTGGCHYDYQCGKYKSICGNCPAIQSKRNRDFSTWNQAQKRKILKDGNIRIVGCSRWIANCARESTVMKELTCSVIPNGINTDIYTVINRMTALEALKLGRFHNKKIILFGAMDSTSDDRKGYVYLKKALISLDPQKYICLIFGGNLQEEMPLETYSVGFLRDDISLALLYSCADVFVAPSIQENLANTVLESLACGTPVVAFDIGGMPDMIDHKKNGYLAKAYDVDDLARGIGCCCENEKLGVAARNKILEDFTYGKVAEQYGRLYEEMKK